MHTSTHNEPRDTTEDLCRKHGRELSLWIFRAEVVVGHCLLLREYHLENLWQNGKIIGKPWENDGLMGFYGIYHLVITHLKWTI